MGKKKYQYDPFPSFPFPLFPSPPHFPFLPPFFSSPLLSFPVLPLEVGPLYLARRSGERCKLPTHALPSAANAFFWHILSLGNASGRKNFDDFPDNQLAKRIPVRQSARNKWRCDFKPTKEAPVYHTGAYRLTSSPECSKLF